MRYLLSDGPTRAQWLAHLTHMLSSLVVRGFGLEDAFPLTSCATPQITDFLGVVIATTYLSQEEGAVHRTVLAT